MEERTSDRLKQIMTERGLRQVDILDLCKPFSEEFGVKVTKSDLSQYLSDRSLPGQRKLAILGLALNVSEGWLMGFDVPIARRNGAIDYNSPTPKQQELIDLILSLDDDQVDKIGQIIKLVSNQ